MLAYRGLRLPLRQGLRRLILLEEEVGYAHLETLSLAKARSFLQVPITQKCQMRRKRLLRMPEMMPLNFFGQVPCELFVDNFLQEAGSSVPPILEMIVAYAYIYDIRQWESTIKACVLMMCDGICNRLIRF